MPVVKIKDPETGEWIIAKNMTGNVNDSTFVSDEYDATQDQVDEGRKFYVAGERLTGTRPIISAQQTVLTAKTPSKTIPRGAHDGSGKVYIVPEQKTVVPGITEQSVIPSEGKVLSEVVVEAIRTEEKSVSPSEVDQTVTPSDGKYLSEVTVEAIQTEEMTVAPSEEDQTVIPSDGKYFSKVTVKAAPKTDLSGVSATADKVLLGSMFMSADGVLTEGTMNDWSGDLLSSLSVSSDGSGLTAKSPVNGYMTTESGLYLSNESIVSAAGLTADKIASGNTVFGLTGTGGGMKMKEETLTPQFKYPQNGYCYITISAGITAEFVVISFYPLFTDLEAPSNVRNIIYDLRNIVVPDYTPVSLSSQYQGFSWIVHQGDGVAHPEGQMINNGQNITLAFAQSGYSNFYAMVTGWKVFGK